MLRVLSTRSKKLIVKFTLIGPFSSINSLIFLVDEYSIFKAFFGSLKMSDLEKSNVVLKSTIPNCPPFLTNLA